MLWLGAVSLAAWICLLVFRGGFWRIAAARMPRPGGAAPGVAVVVPARNEAGLIGRAAAALAGQRYPGALGIWVVDDHSTDATAAEARAAGPEVTVVAARPLPPGWTGKVWAISEGLEHALASAPRYLLFTDADVVHPPESLAALVAQAEQGGYDLVSLMVKLHCQSFAEKALIPAFVFFFLKLYPPAWIADPRKRTAGAAGGCVLIRAEALHRIGGIAAIRGELIDDCALAAAVKRSGGRVWLGLAGDTASIRPYRGAPDIWKMISRTAFTQLRHSAVLLALTLAGMFVIYMAPPLAALGGTGTARWVGAAAWALMSIAYLPAVRFYRLSPPRALTLPLIAAFYAAATVDSAVRYWRRAGGEWKGRVQDRRPA
jgi:hopene-associated glycosyltransferase HpnB